ncbi:TetR/AcrR family transcriptional regulator [Actinomadura sp. ATCC 31491]|uniref:TetR/AcrR family transcriptional regulator n=1 Tax=Actinomadura luzonensis TaxID=2805427 RepID=A0ABT0FWQ7_9ACTN|nr:TetR family transcriptional regulator [Actinomadura luzonensis]MCK2216313.1 TetR/AcrR family transcriptional regulator [Actinomadura luzonensis]
MTGLRQLQRLRVREAISGAAVALFLRRGFDEVPVAEIAAAAGVSKPTLFKYFPAKEDLVLHRIADHEGEAARVVRGRAAGEPPLEALRRHFLDGLARRDPVTGLNDHPEVVAFHRMVFSTPSLQARLFQQISRDERALAEALSEPLPGRASSGAGAPAGTGGGLDELTAALLAAQVLAAQRVLARRTWQLIADGRPLSEVEPEAIQAANRAFSLLAICAA